jgi:uncharacterized membrane protein YphA (DoxX/SURF4 family)
MAARKRAARGKRGGEDAPVRLWPPKLGLAALRVFAGLVFLAVAHHKWIAPLEEHLPDGRVVERHLSARERVVIFAERDLVPRVDAAIAHPPHVFGWELRGYADFLAAVVRPGKAPYVFAALIMAFEALLGLTLVLGVATRLMGFLGALLVTAFGLAKALPFLTVTRGTNWYLVMILLTLCLTAAGRLWGLDARLRRRLPGWIA